MLHCSGGCGGGCGTGGGGGDGCGDSILLLNGARSGDQVQNSQFGVCTKTHLHSIQQSQPGNHSRVTLFGKKKGRCKTT